MSNGWQRVIIAAAWVVAIGLRPHIGGFQALVADPAGVLANQGADSVIGDLASAGLWAGCVWLALASAAVAATQLPGLTGRGAGLLARHLAPRVMRRALAAALGVGIAITPALANADPAPTPSVSVTWPLSTDPASTDPGSTDRASTDPASTHPGSTDRASTAPAPAPTWPVDSPAEIDLPASQAPINAAGPDRPASDVLVEAGDTLWSISATALGPGADPDDVATAWPQWYRANAEAIGADPDLIRPGLTLHAPVLGDQS